MSPYLYLAGSENLYYGPVVDNSAHQHNALQLCFNPQQAFNLTIEGDTFSSHGAIIGANIPHQLDTLSHHCLLLFFDAETHISKQIAQQLLGNCSWAQISTSLCKQIFQPLQIPLSSDHAQQILDACMDNCIDTHMANIVTDQRIEQAIQHLKSLPLKHISLQKLADSVHLSPSRLAHLFKQHVGIPLRRYLQWLRLAQAMKLISQQHNLTKAAHLTGFSDSAHLSRTFKMMFGVTPNSIFKHSEFLKVLEHPKT